MNSRIAFDIVSFSAPCRAVLPIFKFYLHTKEDCLHRLLAPVSHWMRWLFTEGGAETILIKEMLS